jgi:hypothetical protein
VLIGSHAATKRAALQRPCRRLEAAPRLAEGMNGRVGCRRFGNRARKNGEGARLAMARSAMLSQRRDFSRRLQGVASSESLHASRIGSNGAPGFTFLQRP